MKDNECMIGVNKPTMLVIIKLTIIKDASVDNVIICDYILYMNKKDFKEKCMKLADTLFNLLDQDDDCQVEKNIFNEILEREIIKVDYISAYDFRENMEKVIDEVSKEKNIKEFYENYRTKMLYFIHKVIRLHYKI